jgi:hypothetical protein
LKNLKGSNRLGDIGIDERIILKRILKKYLMGMWTGVVCLRIGSGGLL